MVGRPFIPGQCVDSAGKLDSGRRARTVRRAETAPSERECTVPAANREDESGKMIVGCEHEVRTVTMQWSRGGSRNREASARSLHTGRLGSVVGAVAAVVPPSLSLPHAASPRATGRRATQSSQEISVHERNSRRMRRGRDLSSAGRRNQSLVRRVRIRGKSPACCRACCWTSRTGASWRPG